MYPKICRQCDKSAQGPLYGKHTKPANANPIVPRAEFSLETPKPPRPGRTRYAWPSSSHNLGWYKGSNVDSSLPEAHPGFCCDPRIGRETSPPADHIKKARKDCKSLSARDLHRGCRWFSLAVSKEVMIVMASPGDETSQSGRQKEWDSSLAILCLGRWHTIYMAALRVLMPFALSCLQSGAFRFLPVLPAQKRFMLGSCARRSLTPRSLCMFLRCGIATSGLKMRSDALR